MKTIICDGKEYLVDLENSVIMVDNQKIEVDVQISNHDEIHFIFQQKNYRAILKSRQGRSAVISLNEKDIEVSIVSQKEKILQKIGISHHAQDKIQDLMAPMPGKILKVLKKPGENILKNEGVLVLEAMKMENVLKASSEAVISEIKVSEGEAVEKDQILITFE